MASDLCIRPGNMAARTLGLAVEEIEAALLASAQDYCLLQKQILSGIEWAHRLRGLVGGQGKGDLAVGLLHLGFGAKVPALVHERRLASQGGALHFDVRRPADAFDSGAEHRDLGGGIAVAIHRMQNPVDHTCR